VEFEDESKGDESEPHSCSMDKEYLDEKWSLFVNKILFHVDLTFTCARSFFKGYGCLLGTLLILP